MSEFRPSQAPDDEMAKITEAAIGILELGEAAPAEVQSMPPAVIEAQIADAAEELGVTPDKAAALAELASREDTAADLARRVLAEIERNEALASEISEAYERRRDLMVIDPLTISAAALLLLVLRVRRVRVSKQTGVDITLDPLKSDVVNAVLSFVGGRH